MGTLIVNSLNRYPRHHYRIVHKVIIFPKTLNGITKSFTIAKILQLYDVCQWDSWIDIEYIDDIWEN